MAELDVSRRFGEKLRTLRRQRKITMQTLAKELGTGSGYISQVENSQRQPRAAFVFQVSQFFGVSTDALLDDSREV